MTSLGDVLAGGQPILLDGGLATQLERRGHDLSDALWSARLLLDEPDEVRAAHADFFAAGAQVAITASYQVSASGFAAARRDPEDVETALRRSVALARAAAESATAAATVPSPAMQEQRWVAASVGPYGAALADGSEYRGDYGRTVAELRAWHRPRLEILADAGADVLAMETIPCLAEVEALLIEVARLDVPAWLSLSATGGETGLTTRLGEPLGEAFAMAADVPSIIAIGANCFEPALVAGVAATARPYGRPVLAYPNSGEVWDANARAWAGEPTIGADAARRWLAAGVQLIGGCCRVGPELIAAMRAAFPR